MHIKVTSESKKEKKSASLKICNQQTKHCKMNKGANVKRERKREKVNIRHKIWPSFISLKDNTQLTKQNKTVIGQPSISFLL